SMLMPPGSSSSGWIAFGLPYCCCCRKWPDWLYFLVFLDIVQLPELVNLGLYCFYLAQHVLGIGGAYYNSYWRLVGKGAGVSNNFRDCRQGCRSCGVVTTVPQVLGHQE